MRLWLDELNDLRVDLRDEPPRHLTGYTRWLIFYRWCLWSGFLIAGVVSLALGVALLTVGAMRRGDGLGTAAHFFIMGYLCAGLSLPMLLAGLLPMVSVTRLLEHGAVSRVLVLGASPADPLEPPPPTAWRVRLRFFDHRGREQVVSQVLSTEELGRAHSKAGLFILYDSRDPSRVAVLADTPEPR